MSPRKYTRHLDIKGRAAKFKSEVPDHVPASGAPDNEEVLKWILQGFGLEDTKENRKRIGPAFKALGIKNGPDGRYYPTTVANQLFEEQERQKRLERAAERQAHKAAAANSTSSSSQPSSDVEDTTTHTGNLTVTILNNKTGKVTTETGRKVTIWPLVALALLSVGGFATQSLWFPQVQHLAAPTMTALAGLIP